MMTKAKTAKRSVSVVALVQRFNRRVPERLVRTPRGKGRRDKSFFVVDVKRNVVVADKLTLKQLEAIARQHGILADWEEVTR
jgi:hypothetical protein